jgi:hypothetical protein
MVLYERSPVLLANEQTPQAHVLMANTSQYQGHSCVTCGRYAAALQYGEQAIERYRCLEMGMQAAITSVLAGHQHIQADKQG